MFRSLRDIREFIFVVLKLCSGRLKRLEADVEVLKTTLVSLPKPEGVAADGIASPDNALYAALFNAGARALETERLSGLYESLANRVALLEHQSDTKDNGSKDQERESPAGREIVETFEQFLVRDRTGNQQDFSNSKAYVGQLAKEYVRAAKERDALLNARDKWLNERQQLVRQVEADRSSASRAPKFPPELENLYEKICLSVVDVGAQNLVSEAHVYSRLVDTGAAYVIGFEPLKDEANTRGQSEQDVLMLNHFIGDGNEGVFHLTRFNPASSLLQANKEFLGQFVALSSMCDLVSEESVKTTRLDDVPEIGDCDFLKIDVQGGELAVLRGATNLLEHTIVVHSEVEFAPIYKDQPLFSDVDVFLRAQDFELIDIMKLGYAGYSDLPRPLATSRLMWADAVYFKSPEKLSMLGPAKLIRAAYIAHVNYEMYDLAARYLRCLDEMVGSDARRIYGEKVCEISAPS